MALVNRTSRIRSFLPHHWNAVNAILVAVLLTGFLTLSFGCASSNKPSTRKKPTQFSFWPLFPDDPRVQYLTSYSDVDDVNRRSRNVFEDIVYGSDEGMNPALVQKPYGVEMANGRIYVCDIVGGSVAVLDLAKRETRVMGTTGSNPLSQPVDVAIADDGLIYVADSKRGVVFVYDKNERSTAVFGLPNLFPVGLAIYEDELFVVDMTSQSVLVLDRFSGEQKRSIGERGADDGQFVSPLGIAVDNDGNVYVTDVVKCRIQKFTKDGALISAFGKTSDQLGNFVRPKQIQVDSEGYIYVVDAGYANVQIFNPDFELLMFFGAAGKHPGAMFLPVGISVYEGDMSFAEEFVNDAFKPKRLIAITNQFGENKIALYALGDLRPGYTVNDIVSTSVAATGTTDQGGRQIGQIGSDEELDDYSVEEGEEAKDEKEEEGG